MRGLIEVIPKQQHLKGWRYSLSSLEKKICTRRDHYLFTSQDLVDRFIAVKWCCKYRHDIRWNHLIVLIAREASGRTGKRKLEVNSCPYKEKSCMEKCFRIHGNSSETIIWSQIAKRKVQRDYNKHICKDEGIIELCI